MSLLHLLGFRLHLCTAVPGDDLHRTPLQSSCRQFAAGLNQQIYRKPRKKIEEEVGHAVPISWCSTVSLHVETCPAQLAAP